MDAELIPIQFDKVVQSKSYTCIVLGTEQKKFAIYTDLASGKAMQLILTDTDKSRPPTHDFLANIFRGFEIKVRQVVINDVQDTIYFARIFLEKQIGDVLHIIEIDARPSDCITLALIHKTPVFCTKDVLDRVVACVE